MGNTSYLFLFPLQLGPRDLDWSRLSTSVSSSSNRSRRSPRSLRQVWNSRVLPVLLTHLAGGDVQDAKEWQLVLLVREKILLFFFDEFLHPPKKTHTKKQKMLCKFRFFGYY